MKYSVQVRKNPGTDTDHPEYLFPFMLCFAKQTYPERWGFHYLNTLEEVQYSLEDAATKTALRGDEFELVVLDRIKIAPLGTNSAAHTENAHPVAEPANAP